MWNLDSIDKHAELHIVVNGTQDAQCRITCGTEITGVVSIFPRSDFGFGVNLVLLAEEESISNGQKDTNYQIVHMMSIGEIVAGIHHMQWQKIPF